MGIGVEYISIGAITQDILNLARGGQLSQSEPISKLQIEGWIHQYRSILLKQSLDKGQPIDPNFVQTISSVELEEVNVSDPSSIETEYSTFRTKIKIPKAIRLNKGPAFTYIGTITGQSIMFVPEHRSQFQKFKKYTSQDPISFLRDGYLYIENDREIRYISIRGVFENPSEISHMNNPTETVEDITANSSYPISMHLLPTLKKMILEQEMGIIVQAFSDVSNDSASKIESNIEGDIKYTSRLNK